MEEYMDAYVSSNAVGSAVNIIPVVSSAASSSETVQYPNEPGEIVDSPNGGASPPHWVTRRKDSSGASDDASDDAGGLGNNGSSTASNPIASDHCYGLPYQDHNYGSSSSQTNRANNTGNGNGNGGASGNQRRPSPASAPAPTVAPVHLVNSGTTSNGGSTFTGRRLSYYPGGVNSKLTMLPRFSPAAASSSAASGAGHFVDEDISGVYNSMATSNAIGDHSSPPNGSGTTSFPSNDFMTGGQAGITVTTGSHMRNRVRSVSVRHNVDTPAIHPRLAPPYPGRMGLTTQPPRPSTTMYRGLTSRLVTAGRPTPAIGPNVRCALQPHPYSMKPPTSARQMVSCASASTLEGQPKRPGRPKGPRVIPQQQAIGRVAGAKDSSAPKVPRRPRKTLSQQQQQQEVAGIMASGQHTPFSPAGLMSQQPPMAYRTSVDSEAVSGGPAPPLPLLQPYQQQQTVHEQMGGPLMVGTSPVIPAHPMFGNSTNTTASTAGLIMQQQQQQQQQQVSSQEKLPTSPSTSAPVSTQILGKEGFRESYNNMMSALLANMEEAEKKEAISPVRNQQQRTPVSSTEGKKNGPGRTGKVKSDQTLSSPSDPLLSPSGPSGGTDEEDGNSEDEWQGKDYTTRCLCQMKHNDEFMIQCDQCEVWQHCECMGIDTKNVPDNYLCEQCHPRQLKLTGPEAQCLQQAKVLQWKKRKAAAAAARRRRRMASAARSSISSSRSGGGGKGPKTAAVTSISRKRTISSGQANPNKRAKLTDDQFVEIMENICKPKVAKVVRAWGDTAGAASLLSQLRIEPPCKSMYVAAGRQGLVATDTILPDMPVSEYRGKVCWYTDFEIPDGMGGRIPNTLPYVLYYHSAGADGSQVLSVCVDARESGSSARFVRRSCQPNSQVKHVVYDGKLHLLLVSMEMIECGAEITIPFDYDLDKCNMALECACSNSPLLCPNAECPIERRNKSLACADSVKTNGNGVLQSPMDTALQTGDSPVKRRPGRPPGSGRTPQPNNRNASTSAATAALKKAKKARRFKVRIVGKKAKGGGGGTTRPKQHKPQQQSRPAKKFKPSATADVTKRRLSEDVVSTSVEEGRSAVDTPGSPPATWRKPTGRAKAASPIAAPPDIKQEPQEHQQQPLTREERKMQTLMEQISRMEQREQKKMAKRRAKVQRSDCESVSGRESGRKAVRMVGGGRRKRTSISKTAAGTRRYRAKSEATPWTSGSGKRPRNLSENGETSSSSSADTYEQDMAVYGKSQWPSPGNQNLHDLIKASTSLSDSPTTSASLTSPPSAPHKVTTGDVAKKRWLRQAMSEESNKGGTLVLAAAAEALTENQVDTKLSTDSAPVVQSSPPIAAPPPKKRIVQEFSNASSASSDLSQAATGNRVSESQCKQDSNSEGPISTVEAAQLLAELHQHQVGTEQTGAAWGEQEVKQEEATGTGELKVIYPEEGSPAFPSSIVTESISLGRVSAGIGNAVDGTEPDLVVEELAGPAGNGTTGRQQQLQKKKVSFDEYKKRKRESVNDADNTSPITNFTTTSPNSAIVTGNSQRQQSFIPQIGETDVKVRNIRLSSVPDPQTIGKSSTTLEDLRKRIYNKSFGRNSRQSVEVDPTHSDASPSSPSVTPVNNNTDPATGTSVDTGVAAEQATPPQERVALPDGESVEESPEAVVHRLSLSDRLRVEFGLD